MTTIPARPTTYKGVEMRSRLEARYAQWLDDFKIAWTYEPRCFASESGQYLPDFQVHDVHIQGKPQVIYIEVKPTFAIARSSLAIERMTVIWDSDPHAWLVLECGDVGYSIIAWPPFTHPQINQSRPPRTVRGQWAWRDMFNGPRMLVLPRDREWTRPG